MFQDSGVGVGVGVGVGGLPGRNGHTQKADPFHYQHGGAVTHSTAFLRMKCAKHRKRSEIPSLKGLERPTAQQKEETRRETQMDPELVKRCSTSLMKEMQPRTNRRYVLIQQSGQDQRV